MIKCNIITYRRGPGERGSPWSPCTPQRLVLTAILHPKRAEIREKCWILLFCRLCRHFLAVLLREKKVRKRFKNGEDGGKNLQYKVREVSEMTSQWAPSLTSDLLTWPALHSARTSLLHKAARRPAELLFSTPWSQIQPHNQDSIQRCLYISYNVICNISVTSLDCRVEVGAS